MVPKALAQVCRGWMHIHVGRRKLLPGARRGAAALTWASSELRAAATLQVTDMSCHRSPAQVSWQMELAHCRLNNDSVAISGSRLRQETYKLWDLTGFFEPWEKTCLEFISILLLAPFRKLEWLLDIFWYMNVHFQVCIKQLTGVSKSYADNYLVSVILVIKK